MYLSTALVGVRKHGNHLRTQVKTKNTDMGKFSCDITTEVLVK